MASSLSVPVTILCLSASVSAQLSPTFYSRSCPRALATIKAAVTAAVAQEPRMGASLLRLHFRDCFLGGPSWRVLLGRRDSTASLSLANSDLPAPTLDLANLTAAFARKGLSSTDLVALSGAHTIGLAQCLNFRGHIYNDTNVNPAFATLRRANCPAAAGNGDGNLAPLDTTTATVFDNAYYTNLVARSGLLHSDQQLFNGGATDGLVRTYASTPTRFNRDFGAAMIRMGNISPLTGSQGQIRLACSRVN
ncbi:peroxidase 70 [Panicum miliaceum]|uniref:peroxidase n=1 Tax=Panicum miliaceum TaxID=4540 RepID=A0A3L6TF35_PANMI|nr:peroxidase 70 [Panicum miliaceum]